ncbi:MAG TPA: hypothetical protein VLI55_10940 [Bryobacteraceae bacterium]|nr:hypothetical protein [Bryobacteraceae bacterium]
MGNVVAACCALAAVAGVAFKLGSAVTGRSTPPLEPALPGGFIAGVGKLGGRFLSR